MMVRRYNGMTVRGYDGATVQPTKAIDPLTEGQALQPEAFFGRRNEVKVAVEGLGGF